MKNLNTLELHRFEQDSHRFYCNTFSAHVLKHHGEILVPHKHDFYLVVLFTQGTGVHEIDFVRYEIQPGALFVLSPGQSHFWQPSADAEGLILFHSREFYDLAFADHSLADFSFYSSLTRSSMVQLVAPLLEEVYQLMSLVLREYSGQGLWRHRKIQMLLGILYTNLARVCSQSVDSGWRIGRYAAHLTELERLINVHYKAHKSAGVYAEMLNLTVRHLNRVVREQLNKSTTELIMERVVLEAKRLLVNSLDVGLTEVAEQLGFDDYAYFSRIFKKYTGVSPSTFAQQYKSSYYR
ncbi:MAG: helix-turn-helix transcriptional regulator [Bacteroidota bacterium]|nr:helix-turn-helix transcriptional regulator [Bacteroidota bacterium]